MISCTDLMAEMGNYLDGEVAAEVRTQLQEHLAHCQTCTILVDSARKTMKIVTDAGSFDLPEATFRPIAERIMARIREVPK